jgi:alkylation response protein AidB-like acyl-CoA dehydrogenase
MTEGDAAPRAYRLSGTKHFITNGGVAQIFTVLARAPGGPSFFVVERTAPGVSVGAPEKKHGIRASNTTQVILDQVEVPVEQLLGRTEGKGLEQANQVFGFTRLMVAAFGLGAGEEALQRAIDYGHERVQFGEPLYRKQGFTHRLIVPHVVRLEAARAYCEEVARRLDAGGEGLQVEGAIAKYFATEAGNAAADAAIQAHGGYGYTHEYEVEKIRRDVRITTIYEGTSEIQQNIIGTHRWRLTVKTRGGFYRDLAAALQERGSGGAAALAADALADAILTCHAKRLPREQYVLMELARLAAEVETAVALAHKAAAGSRRSDLLPACARLHGGAAARDVVMTALRLLHGSGGCDDGEIADFRSRVRFEEVLATASGELELMDRVVAALESERLG